MKDHPAMKHAPLSPLLLAGALFATNSLAQEAAPPAAEATEAAAPATDAVEATVEAATEATVEATAEATTEATAEASAEAATTEPAPAASAAPAGELNATVQAAIGAPEAGKAQVVFFRPSKFVGGAVKFKVREGEVELGKLGSGRYFVANLEPGAHVFTVHSEAKDVTNVELEAGETYFMAGSISMGVMVGRPNLAPSDAAAFEAALKKLKKG
jgi:hypothetical protein